MAHFQTSNKCCEAVDVLKHRVNNSLTMRWLLLLNLIAANLRFSIAAADHPYEIQKLPDDSWYWRRSYHACGYFYNHIYNCSFVY
jgi:hypothetical protein